MGSCLPRALSREKPSIDSRTGCYTRNGLVAFLTAAAYAELGSAVHGAGGGYLWIKASLPDPAGFLAGWMDWFAHAVAWGECLPGGRDRVGARHSGGPDLRDRLPPGQRTPRRVARFGATVRGGSLSGA